MNTLPNTIAYEGDVPGDVEFLIATYNQFKERGETFHIAWGTNGEGRKCWRCGTSVSGMRPTFGATRRDAAEQMIAKIVAKRLGMRASVRTVLKENFNG